MRALATYLLRGNREAIIVVMVCSALALIIPVFGLFNAVIIGLVSLRVGPNNGFMLSGISSAIVAAGMFLFNVMPEQNKGEELLAVVQWVVSLVALVALCGVLRYTRSLQISMLSALGAGIALILGFRLFIQDTVEWWQHSPLKDLFNGTIENVMAQQTMVNHQMLEGLSASLVGLFIATFLASLFIHLYLARSWQAAMFNPGGFKEEFCQLSYGRVPALVAIGSLVLFMLAGAENLAGFVSLATLWLMGMMYIFYGFAVISGIFKSKNWSVGYLFGGMLLLMLVASAVLQGSFQQPVIGAIIIVIFVLASVGFIDTFLDFRKKVQNQMTDQ